MVPGMRSRAYVIGSLELYYDKVKFGWLEAPLEHSRYTKVNCHCMMCQKKVLFSTSRHVGYKKLLLLQNRRTPISI